MAEPVSASSRVAAFYPGLGGVAFQAGDVQPLSAAAGTVMFEEGAPCRGFPLVVAGEIKVARGSPGGRSIELYRVAPGEFCVVSASCLFGRRPMSAHGITTAATELLVMTPPAFARACADEAFRASVFGTFADRLADLMSLTEAVAFQRLDQRLAALLVARGPRLRTTHQALADELGTVREIVTRLLRRFERDGLVAGAREQVDLLDVPALQRLAGGG
jgi:CRP/FNR family transcriptional regulator